jgi:hypothetical protein
MALDDRGFAHAAYYDKTAQNLMYASNYGGMWFWDRVDHTVNKNDGLYPSIALDAQGVVHISYYNDTDGTLMYANNASGDWVTALVDGGVNDVGEFSAIAIDSHGKVHIAYHDRTHENLKYATNAGGSWYRITVDDTDTVGYYIDLALDANDKAHISYAETGFVGDLKYATNAGGSWTDQTVDASFYAGQYSSIAVDANGKVHMTCYEGTNTELHYVNNVEGYWAVSIVDAAGSVGSHTSIALDSQGSPHVSYYDQTNQALKYARYHQGFWESYQVDGGGSGYFTNIALDPTDHPVIVYQGYDKTGSLELKHAELLCEPGPPRNFEAVAGVGEVTLSWLPSWQDYGYDVANYNVYRTDGTGHETLLLTVGDVGEVTDQSALGGTYTYRVAAVNAVGVGLKSEAVEVTVEVVAELPGAPEDLDADAGNGTVTLTWDPPDDDGGTSIIGYKIYRGITEGSEVLLATLGNVDTYLDDTVINGQTYYYKVTAVNAVGEGPSSDVEHATPTADGGIDDDDATGNTMLFIVIAVIALAAGAAVALLVLRKKRS